MSDSVRPRRQQPTRLPSPWDSPGRNTGVGCHFLLQCMKVKSESEVAQSCLTLSGPMDCSLPGSSIHGIFQARVLEWGAIAFSGNIHTTIYKTDKKDLLYRTGSLVVKNLPANAGNAGISMQEMWVFQCRKCDPWVGKIPGEGNSCPLQYSCLENSMDRSLVATVHGVTKNQT